MSVSVRTGLRSVTCIGGDGGWMGRVESLLAGAGYQTSRVADVGRGLAEVSAGRSAAVVLDVSRCGGDWADFCRRMRGNAQTAGVPLMLIAETDDDTRRALASGVGADEVVRGEESGRALLGRFAAMLRRCGASDGASVANTLNGPRKIVIAA